MGSTKQSLVIIPFPIYTIKHNDATPQIKEPFLSRQSKTLSEKAHNKDDRRRQTQSLLRRPSQPPSAAATTLPRRPVWHLPRRRQLPSAAAAPRHRLPSPGSAARRRRLLRPSSALLPGLPSRSRYGSALLCSLHFFKEIFG